ncbi:uncharacterized protein LOC117303462 [Asterias rubens]|uniref:uncharacterized protein LOC117303462 n=1 Tax=Asterias rubens TaxID=7604 RepID=UPI00145540BE|nr:uncharacterized protein LOC117303462 [Asterias rubens]
MAQSHPDESDGIFLEDGVSPTPGDEADFALSVVNLTRSSDIPLRYFLPKIFSPMEASMTRSCQRISEKSPKYRLLNTEWGNKSSSYRDGPGILALVTVESRSLDQQSVAKVESYIKKMMKGTACQLLRWNQHHFLLLFESANDYESFGRLFLEEKLDDCEGFRVTAIEPSILTNPPRCFVEIETLHGTQTRDALKSFISYFSGAFQHASILEIQRLFPFTESLEGDVPRLALTLMFSGKAQSRATEVVKVLSGDPWVPFSLPDAVASELSDDTAYFKHTKLPLPLWGVKTGANTSGVRVTLFVKDSLSFQSMDSFYSKVTGVTPLQQNGDNTAKSSTFPLSPRLEFSLAFYQGVVPQTSQNQLLYFQTNESAIGAEKLAEDHWQLKDPEDNLVVLFTTMK